MIALGFLDPNVFNVLKYLVMSLTISLAADILLDTISGYATAKTLIRRGWAHPEDSSLRLRFRRGVRLRRTNSGVTVFLAVISISIFEMALEFSTGAKSMWIRRTDIVRISKQASNVSSLLQSDPNYILKMRYALERVENTCYNVDQSWYFPVVFNMTNSTDFHGLGKAALCPSNFSDENYVEDDLQSSSFLARDVAALKIWNASELRVGRDAFQSEETFPFKELSDVRIGPTQNFSFVAVNFNRTFMVEGSNRALSGKSKKKRPRALHVANYTVESGWTFECLVKVKWKKKEESGVVKVKQAFPEVCLVPIADGRVVLALFDDVENAKQFQLIMSVALRNVRSFHDLNVLRYLPWMVGTNNGLHTYREIGILTILSGRMVEKISIDGYQDVRIEVGSENITVPTLTVWGIVLLVVGTILLAVAKVILSRSRRKLKFKGNLGTARGVAEQWLERREEFEDTERGKGPVVFVLDGHDETFPAPLSVRRANDLRRTIDDFAQGRPA
ncbi:hypothetical protein FGB62_31g04 [Gracilaria domingensis]|nr:hypothetical protein FGB62_31g04 [Gracilaria domingensis]